MSCRKTSSDVECQGHALASGLGILAVKVVSQTSAVAEHRFDSFSASARTTLAVVWNLVVETPEFVFSGGLKVRIDRYLHSLCLPLPHPTFALCCFGLLFSFFTISLSKHDDRWTEGTRI
jgi:hypothetical protein